MTLNAVRVQPDPLPPGRPSLAMRVVQRLANRRVGGQRSRT